MPVLPKINAVDYGLIVLYLVTVVAVGLYAARRSRSTGDFFKAGGRMPWALAGIYVAIRRPFLFTSSLRLFVSSFLMPDA